MKLHQSHPQKFLILKKKGGGATILAFFWPQNTRQITNYAMHSGTFGSQQQAKRYHTGLYVPYRTLGALQDFGWLTGL